MAFLVENSLNSEAERTIRARDLGYQFHIGFYIENRSNSETTFLGWV